MNARDLFNRLKESDFVFTKPAPWEMQPYSEQKASMSKLIAYGLVEKIGSNKYSLTKEGRKASVLGIEKWAKNLKDKNIRELISYSFNFKIAWYKRPILKEIMESKITSTISNLSIKVLVMITSSLILPIVALIVWKLYESELISIWKSLVE